MLAIRLGLKTLKGLLIFLKTVKTVFKNYGLIELLRDQLRITFLKYKILIRIIKILIKISTDLSIKFDFLSNLTIRCQNQTIIANKNGKKNDFIDNHI
jgi:hypothetical protein